jgi:hypothetical protein
MARPLSLVSRPNILQQHEISNMIATTILVLDDKSLCKFIAEVLDPCFPQAISTVKQVVKKPEQQSQRVNTLSYEQQLKLALEASLNVTHISHVYNIESGSSSIGSNSAAAPKQAPKEQEKKEAEEVSKECEICCTNLKNIALRCGHVYMCDECCKQLRKKECPVCKKAFRPNEAIKLFF